MKAIILAGGKGTRVRPLTDTIPKPMIPIISRPVMEFLIDVLRQHGFDQIMISTSYLADTIESYFREGSRFGVQIGYSFEGYHAAGQPVPEGLGSAGGLKKIQEFSGFCDDTFVVLCGDALIDLDLTAALAFHRERKALATIVLKDVPRDQVGSYGVVKTTQTAVLSSSRRSPIPRTRSVRRSTRASTCLNLKFLSTSLPAPRLTSAATCFRSWRSAGCRSTA